jgi:hypothetical protein
MAEDAYALAYQDAYALAYQEAWEDLGARVERAAESLETEAQRSDARGAARDEDRANALRQKRRGVLLVRSYMFDYDLPAKGVQR